MIINRVTVPGPRQVLLHVKIAEINRSATRSIGVSWVYARGNSIFGSAAGNNATMNFSANSAISQTTATSAVSSCRVSRTVGATNAATPTGNAPLFGVFDSGHFSMFIDALRTNDLAKILAEPNLVALDGQPARFLVGGLFPYPVPQSSSIPGGTAVVTVQFQRFGTILTFLPEILPNDVIRLDVEPVISQLNFDEGNDRQWRSRPRNRSSEAPDRRRAARGTDAGDRRAAPVAHQQLDGANPRSWRSADRRALVQQQQRSRRSRPKPSCS